MPRSADALEPSGLSRRPSGLKCSQAALIIGTEEEEATAEREAKITSKRCNFPRPRPKGFVRSGE